MRILVIGGAGRVGAMIVDRLAREHHVRVADLRARENTGDGVESVIADVTDVESLRRAVRDQDALVYLAMGRMAEWGTTGGWAESHFDVNVKGLYLALRTAAEAGVHAAVYASSASIFADYLAHGHELQDREPDADDGYGLTKRLGEEVCAAAAREHGMNVIALRLCAPMADEDFLAYQGNHPEIRTAGSDVAEAFAAALAQPGTGFEHLMVVGDHEQESITWSRTRERLGWEPKMRIGES